MNHWNRQEQLMLTIVLGLVLTGWAVRAHHIAHPKVVVTAPAHD